MNNFKRSVSSLLAFVMLVGAMLCNLTVSAWADDGTKTWDFRSGSSLMGDTNGKQIQNTTGEVDGLKIDASASGAKWDSKNRTDWAQVNKGTIIDIPVTTYSVVTVTTNSASVSCTFDGEVKTTVNKSISVKSAGTDGYVRFIMGANDYIGTITVFPIVFPETLPTSWDYATLTATNYQGSAGLSNDLYIDATASGAKWADNGGAWVQVCANTVISVPVAAGASTISVTTYDANISMTIDGNSVTSGSSKKASAAVKLSKKGYVDIVFNADNYLGSITVTAEEEIEVPFTITGASTTISFADSTTGVVYNTASESGSVGLLKGHTYNVVVDDSHTVSPTTVTINDNTVQTLNVEEDNAEKYKVTGKIYSLASYPENVAVTDVSSITFTDANGKTTEGTVAGSTYSASLTDGKYTVSVGGVYTTTAHFDVSGEATTKDVYVDEYRSWNFNGMAVSGTAVTEYNGLKCSNAQAHNTQYLYVGSNGYVTVPVSGKKVVTFTTQYGVNITVTDDTTGETLGSLTANSGNNGYDILTVTTNDTTKSITAKASGTTYFTAITIVDYIEDGSTTLKVGSDKTYKTITSALEAAAVVRASNSERITIKVDAGTYNEQVFVNVKDVTIESASGEQDVTITGYYGIGYKYYSVDSTGVYSKASAADKYEKHNAINWGGTVQVTAEGFKAENIIFENSFNRSLTDDELTDGVALSTEGTDSKITVERTKGVDVRSKTYTERAAALVIKADKAELYNCKLLSSQDTLYTGDSNQHIYVKDSYIQGMTDYIFGGYGNAVFDNCQLAWAGYSDINNKYAGYLTAAKGSYLFLNCSVVNSDETGMYQTPGYYGRPWGEDASVKFINTKTNGYILEAGWYDWSTNQTAASANYGEYANTGSNGAFTSSLSNVAMSNDDYNKIIDSIDGTYLGNWTPEHYVGSVADTVDVKEDSNGYVIFYGTVDENKLDEAEQIGFEISTLNNLFGKESEMSNTVYSSINYIDEEGETQTIAVDDKLVFATVLSDVDSGYTVYARAVQKIGDSTVYGKIKAYTKPSTDTTEATE